MEPAADHLFLGEQVDPTTHQRTGTPIHYRTSDLTTHGLIVGMTGSGKTGLGVVLLEEVLLAGVPALVLDPKGDLGNLRLTFPDLNPDDFEPWVNPGDAARKGLDTAAFASETAAAWRDGLASWGLGPDRLRDLRSRADVTIYTPGSTAGVPLNVVGSLRAPDSTADLESLRDEIEGFVSSLLGLVGIAADPIGSHEHVLLSNLIEHAWRQGRDLDLETLVAQTGDPPIRKLGVFDVDAFFPPKDRMALAMRLNGLIASPSFAAWNAGTALDVDTLLRDRTGRPRAAIVSLAHLSDVERQFVVTLLLGRMITWMRKQSGTTDLRALVYMDEVFGFAPPVAAPPSKKPILTLLKQARAFGVGMVLSTQNPVDVDYKAFSNAGTWMIGRLQTERDKARLLDGLESAGGHTDLRAIDATISGLAKREFLLHSTKRTSPVVFRTRWALSYLRGPLTRAQIAALTPSEGDAGGREAAGDPAGASSGSAMASDETPVAPNVAEGTRVRYVSPAAPWMGVLGGVSGGTRLEAGVVTRVSLLYDEARADLRHHDEWEAVFFPLTENPDPTTATIVDFDERDLREAAPGGARYVVPRVPIGSSSYFSGIKRTLRDHVVQNLSIELLHNDHLKLYSRVGEEPEAFARRCEQVAEDLEDLEAARIRDRLETRMDRIRSAINKAEDRVQELETAVDTRQSEELISAAGSILSGFLKGRRGSRSLATELRRASQKRGQTSRARQRVETARNRVEDKVEELARLEDELAEELIALDDDWDARGRDIVTIRVGLEKTDVRVTALALVWIPTG